MNIYVSNLSSNFDSEELKKIFSSYGEVKSAEVVNDLFTGKSRGFGYVDMEDNAQAVNAITGLNQTTHHSLITVEEAKPKTVAQGSYKIGNGPVNMYKFKKN